VIQGKFGALPYFMSTGGVQKSIRTLIDEANTAYNFSRWKEAFTLYSQLEKLIQTEGQYPGCGHVYYRIGFMYNRGHFVKKSPTNARRYFDLSIDLLLQDADQGDSEAFCDLAFMYNVGDGVTIDREKAYRYYQKAAETGYDRGQYNLGFMYSNGLGVERDKKMAAKWYRLAAEQGHTWAQNNLGLLYDTGEGVESNKEIAVYWYRMSADQHHASAQNNMGLMYEKGEGVKKDLDRAVQYYKLAAENGNASAHYNLGRFYDKGDGVKQDRDLAIQYFFEAAMKGQTEAKETVQNILKGDYNDFSKPKGIQYLCRIWPESHFLLNDNCKAAIIEVFVLLRKIPQILPELAAIIAQQIILVWPENQNHKGFSD